MAEVSVLVQQRHVATQINEDEDEGDVEVISTADAKAFKCYACDSWKTFMRRSGKVVLTYYVPKETIASEVVEQEILFLFHPCV